MIDKEVLEEKLKNINIPSIVIPQIPRIPSQGEIAAQKISNKITSATETIRKNELISEIDKLSYELEQKTHEKQKLLNRKKAIEDNNSMKDDIIVIKNISIISIVIPFILKIILEIINCNLFKFVVVIYIIFSFLFSMNKMYKYLRK